MCPAAVMTARRPIGRGWPRNHRTSRRTSRYRLNMSWHSSASTSRPSGVVKRLYAARSTTIATRAAPLTARRDCGTASHAALEAISPARGRGPECALRRRDGLAAATLRLRHRARRRGRPDRVSESALDQFGTPPAKALDLRGITLDAAQAYGIRWYAEGAAWILPIRDADSGVLRGWQTSPRTTRATPRARGRAARCSASIASSPVARPSWWSYP